MFSITEMRTYGLCIRSVIALPELQAGRGGADVVIRRRRRADRTPEDDNGGERIWLRWAEVGTFVALGGTEIIVDPIPDLAEQVLRLYLLGRVLGALLRQRGLLVLHASAVSIAGEGVAFLGSHGWGKSTTAAALHAAGHGVVADDIGAVALTPCGAVIVPGFPRLKLWPEVGRALGERPESLPRVHPELEKREKRVECGFSPRPIPLRRIYVLAEADEPRAECLRPPQALLELLRHSYGAQTLRAVRPGSHFLQCASVARDVPVRRLAFARSLTGLAPLTRFIEEDLARPVG